MRNMSFHLTQDQILAQTKTVTRRNGWDFLKVGTCLQPVRKCQGLKKGEKVVMLGYAIEVIKITKEPLCQITQDDVILEGFPEMTPKQFIEMYCKANKCKPETMVTRIEFHYLPF